MKFIENSKTAVDNKGKLRSYAKFYCEYCENFIIRRLDCGKKQMSCGCIKINIKHGGKYTKLYSVHHSMKQRCSNINAKAYKDYGGRGITVCDEWLDKDTGFINFRDWALNNGYQEGLEIDRIDNNGNYNSDNCRFVTAQENTQNRRTTKLNKEKIIEIRNLYNTGNFLQKYLALKFNISKQQMSRIINNKNWAR